MANGPFNFTIRRIARPLSDEFEANPMTLFDYKPLQPAIVEQLKSICGSAFVIFDDEKKLKKYSHDQVPEEKYAHMP